MKNDGLNPIGPKALSHLHGFAAAAPPGNFILFDMSKYGNGQWAEWGQLRAPQTGYPGIPLCLRTTAIM